MDVHSVAIIILNWNNWQDTVECLESVVQNDYPNYRIIVVDNGSTNDSVLQIRRRFTTIQLLETGKNLGFCGGVNFGIEHAAKSDLVLLLNNDTLVATNFLTELVRKITSDYSIGLTGSKIYFCATEASKTTLTRSVQNKIWSAGGGIHKFTKRTFQFGEGQIDNGQFNREREVDFLSGCCLLVKKEVFETVGLLDPDYFMYYEDVDFCVRASSAGYKICYTPNSVIWHSVGGSSIKSSVDKYRMRNHILLWKKQYSFSFIKIVILLIPIIIERLLRILMRKIISVKSESIRDRINALIEGTLEGLKYQV